MTSSCNLLAVFCWFSSEGAGASFYFLLRRIFLLGDGVVAGDASFFGDNTGVSEGAYSSFGGAGIVSEFVTSISGRAVMVSEGDSPFVSH